MSKEFKGPESFSEILKKKPQAPKPPAYQWQELALSIINDLGIPNFKRSAVFKVCKENSKEFVLMALNDTKELCQEGEPWKYFFKVVGAKKKSSDPE
ncbi:hypothetical protein GF382_00845 [Candidatus Falkowbacteria bacterium]|nr:hypothetical protein [Candidatus Falkowbacteria bacterium]